MSPRDMSKKQFVAALMRNGMALDNVILTGYTAVYIPSRNLHVYAPNAGNSRRAQLAYLLREKERYMSKDTETLI